MVNKLKVIHIVSSLNVGGAERFVIDLGGEQQSQGNDVAILSFGSSDDTLVNVAKKKGIKTYTIEKAASVLGQFNLLRVLNKFDVIHIHTAYALKPLSIVMKVIGRKQCVYTRHGAAENNSLSWQNIHHKFKRYIKAMSFVSQEAFDIFKRNYPWHDIPMSVVDNGVLLPDITHYAKVEENKLHIGSVGRLVPLKHQISLLKAISILPEVIRGSIELHIFGDGECEQTLRSFVKVNLLETSIHFYGMVTDREKIYPSFDCLVVTSETEGLSLVIMEAMAYAKPVIATDVGGNSKLVKPNENGWLVDYDDHHQLAKLIQNLSQDTEMITSFGIAAREYVTETFSLEAVVGKYAEIYQK
ncbi:MAG: glycosyltransferase involved in cell wall biosynthesis [Alteromonadaceae bacterium]|jgi:glycosyltransferase involved in cell wall biosynthesis